MTVEEARVIALGSPTAGLGKPTKMPGYSLGLSALDCRRGSELAKDPTTVCAHCYARSGLYPMRAAREAHRLRLAALRHPAWVEAMVVLIKDATEVELRLGGTPYFRWHDSGDLQGVWHLINILRVCDQTPTVRHWLPTHEVGMLVEYARQRRRFQARRCRGDPRPIPPNLCLRVSADKIGGTAALPEELADLFGDLAKVPTSTVHRGHGAHRVVQVSDDRADSVECKAGTRGKGAGGAGECGSCRACWDTQVRNVSYPIHGERERKYQLRLPIVDG